MTDVLRVVAAVGFTFFWSFAFVNTSGLLGVFALVKRLAERGPAWLSKGIGCETCVGFWAALVAAYAVVYPSQWTDAALLVSAIAGASTYLHTRS